MPRSRHRDPSEEDGEGCRRRCCKDESRVLRQSCNVVERSPSSGGCGGKRRCAEESRLSERMRASGAASRSSRAAARRAEPFAGTAPVVQEFVTRAVSFIFSNCGVQEPHSAERLEMAVSELEFVLERTAKLPITDLSLLRRRKMFKLAYAEGTDLFHMHRQGHHGGEGMAKQVMTFEDSNGSRNSRANFYETWRSAAHSGNTASATLLPGIFLKVKLSHLR
ncbi:hypothetical protein PR202_ga28493 [Eleusine coracana subsp. coracana]|uniref:Uncharacterized protein n=1 Tax=Eleusine coracana subsp. coracana TaxID=191504 RepID=A0AAV5DJE0_ELECO|nr:hypothetical protein PR202_ga28493 [Eleusine coracana subsp. coracana]